jgi:hypothetical protein
MGLDGMVINSGGGLSTEVAGFGIKIERAHAMGTLCAAESYATLDALESIGFHCLNCSCLALQQGTRWSGGESNGKRRPSVVTSSGM